MNVVVVSLMLGTISTECCKLRTMVAAIFGEGGNRERKQGGRQGVGVRFRNNLTI